MTTSSLNLDAYWMPFTANRQFKHAPRMLASAQGMYYTSVDGRQILDGIAGLWCVNAGHCRAEIAEAIARQAQTLDYATAFQMGHPQVFELAEQLTQLIPPSPNQERFSQVFFANSGSEAVESALKIAIAYHRMRGEGQRVKLIGRERGYHGVNFGGLGVGGISPNRKLFSNHLIPHTDHLPHTHNLIHNAFTQGQPAWGAHLADELERLVALHDASTIAAVIVEPVAGSTGVLIPPQGYLQRLRQICDQHGIVLIFDEVITGFGRLGASFAADYFGVMPDLISVAKGLTNGAVPMGAVLVRNSIYEAFMQGPASAIEFAHGYTYSGHPLACAAALATLTIYQREGLFERAASLADYWQTAIHSLRGLPGIIDLRNLGLVGAIELDPLPGQPGVRAFNVFQRCFEAGLLIRTTGDIIALSPPLIIEKAQIDQIMEILSQIIISDG